MTPLTEEVKERVTVALRDGTVSGLRSPDEIHVFAVNWNWDRGVEPLYEVLRSPLCDKGTALLVYWYCSPVAFYERHGHEESVEDAHERTIYRLMKEAEARCGQGSYTHQTIRFDPAADWQEPYRGEPLKQPIPPAMLQPSPGERVKKSDIWLDAE